ncbi:ATPase [Planctomicrobium sp. SH668]|uniref:ATPase n=1 Tax=Planctomicrobium sp. SH668 TaxID=3448126 RepID=UPI003F5BF932
MSQGHSTSDSEQQIPASQLEGVTTVPDAIELSDDIYEQIIQQVREISDSIHSGNSRATETEAPAVLEEAVDLCPAAPLTLEAAGISLVQLSDLVLKLMYLQGTQSALELCRQVRLPFSVLLEALNFLKRDYSIEATSGEMDVVPGRRFQLTENGRNRAREAFEVCRYVGPAPVSLEHYVRQCRLQAIKYAQLAPEGLERAIDDLILDQELIQRLGPAVASGHSIFFYGPSGNGKTVIAKALGRWLNCFAGAIYVPYAVTVENQMIAVFDPSVHRTVPGQKSEPLDDWVLSEKAQKADLRWQQVSRPFIVTGGELTLEALELRFNSASGYYTAPLQMKSNGGVFLLDDFGRQLIPAAQLRNRWIQPLEERMDSLSLASGKKIRIPFEQLVVFSTNLKLEGLVDSAFLRRVRHKFEISYPSESRFREIFKQACEKSRIHYDDWIVSRLFSTYFGPESLPKASDPHDLLDVVQAICRFRGEPPHLSENIAIQAFQECVGGPNLAN